MPPCDMGDFPEAMSPCHGTGRIVGCSDGMSVSLAQRLLKPHPVDIPRISSWRPGVLSGCSRSPFKELFEGVKSALERWCEIFFTFF